MIDREILGRDDARVGHHRTVNGHVARLPDDEKPTRTSSDIGRLLVSDPRRERERGRIEHTAVTTDARTADPRARVGPVGEPRVLFPDHERVRVADVEVRIRSGAARRERVIARLDARAVGVDQHRVNVVGAAGGARHVREDEVRTVPGDARIDGVTARQREAGAAFDRPVRLDEAALDRVVAGAARVGQQVRPRHEVVSASERGGRVKLHAAVVGTEIEPISVEQVTGIVDSHRSDALIHLLHGQEPDAVARELRVVPEVGRHEHGRNGADFGADRGRARKSSVPRLDVGIRNDGPRATSGAAQRQDQA